jgi:heme-degrading monooxygenase HmoA
MKPSLILLVKFKSPLSLEEVEKVIESRIDEFRALKGLQQKYYLQEPATQEYAGLYLWESKEDFDAYRDSELRATIAKAYQTEGEPRIEVFNVLRTLRK